MPSLLKAMTRDRNHERDIKGRGRSIELADTYGDAANETRNEIDHAKLDHSGHPFYPEVVYRPEVA